MQIVENSDSQKVDRPTGLQKKDRWTDEQIERKAFLLNKIQNIRINFFQQQQTR
jgi:hypothetical protein